LKKRDIEYFELLNIGTKVNKGLIGPLTKHSLPEKMSKLKNIGDSHYKTAEHAEFMNLALENLYNEKERKRMKQ
jgi:hypothetical protein